MHIAVVRCTRRVYGEPLRNNYVKEIEMSTRYAIILVAGEGKRMRPFTDTKPKCMVEICNKSILINALDLFEKNGVEIVRIVIGHLGSIVKNQIGKSFKGMKIEYIENDDYAKTNSMYSLYLGLQGLQEASWVLEGDVFFEKEVLTKPLCREVSWFVDASRKDLDGAYILYNDERRAMSLDIIRDVKLISNQCGKSIGMLHLSSIGVEHFKKWLKQGVDANQTNLYYDLIVRSHFIEVFVEIVDVSGLKWFEIDNMTDLESARQLFQ
jgi:L-glutamine-phosphate cytidylyltransferase